MFLVFPLTGRAARDFPVPTGLVSDFTGTISTSQFELIEGALEESNQKTGLDGRVVFVRRTDEWYLDEFAKDYGDFLQARGVFGRNGWVLYISTGDHKFTLAVQDEAQTTLNLLRKSELLLLVDGKLRSGNPGDAALAGVKAVADMPSLPGARAHKGKNMNIFFFVGISVILFTIMMRTRRIARSATSTR
jgi:hypothetical protein